MIIDDLFMIDDLFDFGYYDSVGGYHDSGIGHSPLGEWCGECCWESCEQCPYARKMAEIE